MVGLSRGSMYRRTTRGLPLLRAEASRVLGLHHLVDEVQSMVEESGNPEGFDTGHWLCNWLHEPLPALGGRLPAEYMKTFEGQQLVSAIVARMRARVQHRLRALQSPRRALGQHALAGTYS